MRPRGGPICPVLGVPPIRATYQCAHLPFLQRFHPVGARSKRVLARSDPGRRREREGSKSETGQGLEVVHDIPPHSPVYRQADWDDWGAPGAILLSTKHLENISKCQALFVRPSGGPICPVLGVPPIRATYQCAHLLFLKQFRAVGAPRPSA